MKTTRSLSRIVPALLGLISAATASAQAFWINEFHYDNAGTDTGEFVEIVAPADFSALASVRLTLYNGGDGSPYGSPHLLSSFTRGSTDSGLTFYSKSITLQNGAPDGFALDVDGAVQQFVSYEGRFTATAGPAAGRMSTSISFGESEATPVGASVGLTGWGRDPSQFVWDTTSSASPGLLNVGQSFSPVPEPSSYAVCAGMLLGGFAWMRRRTRSRAAGPACGRG